MDCLVFVIFISSSETHVRTGLYEREMRLTSQLLAKSEICVHMTCTSSGYYKDM